MAQPVRGALLDSDDLMEGGLAQPSAAQPAPSTPKATSKKRPALKSDVSNAPESSSDDEETVGKPKASSSKAPPRKKGGVQQPKARKNGGKAATDEGKAKEVPMPEALEETTENMIAHATMLNSYNKKDVMKFYPSRVGSQKQQDKAQLSCGVFNGQNCGLAILNADEPIAKVEVITGPNKGTKANINLSCIGVHIASRLIYCTELKDLEKMGKMIPKASSSEVEIWQLVFLDGYWSILMDVLKLNPETWKWPSELYFGKTFKLFCTRGEYLKRIIHPREYANLEKAMTRLEFALERPDFFMPALPAFAELTWGKAFRKNEKLTDIFKQLDDSDLFKTSYEFVNLKYEPINLEVTPIAVVT